MENIILSKELKNYLKTGKCFKEKYFKNGKIDKQRIEYDIIYSLVAQRYSIESIKKLFEKSESHLKFLKNSNWVENAIDKARCHYAQNKQEDFDVIIDKLLEQCQFLPLKAGLRTTLLTIFQICKSAKTFDVYLSLNYLSKLTDLKIETISKQLIKLRNGDFPSHTINFPYIEVIEKFVPHKKPNKYRVHGEKIYRMMILGESKNKIPRATNKSYRNINELNSEVSKKIGKTGKLIWEYLNQHPKEKYSSRDLSNVLGLAFQTCNNKLKYLAEKNYLKFEKGKTTKRNKTIYWIE